MLQGQSGIPEVRSGNKKQQRSPSPPLFNLFAEAESLRTGRDRRLRREEATQTITEECERLFCDALRGTFLVEREVPVQKSLVMGASVSKATGANSDPVKLRKSKSKEISGSLHPSWEAAKKAKEQKTTAPFQGKKVVFE